MNNRAMPWCGAVVLIKIIAVRREREIRAKFGE